MAVGSIVLRTDVNTMWFHKQNITMVVDGPSCAQVKTR